MAYEGAAGSTSSPTHIPDSGQQQNLSVKESNGVTYEAIELQDNTSVSVKARDLTSQILGFLSRANNDTLGACLAGLVAITYLILGRVGLVVIGVFVGVVLHTTWEEIINTHGNAPDSIYEIRKRKQEQGFAILERVLDWRERKTSNNGFEYDDVAEENSPIVLSTELDFSDFPPSTGAALTNLTEAVIRDYVKWWYSPILPTEFSFPTSCRKTLTKFLVAISSHLSRKRPADAFLNFLTNSSSIVIVFLNEFSSALMTASSSNTDCSQALYKYLESNPDSNLANVLDVEQQKKKLHAVADDILQTFSDSKAYQFEPSRNFLQEVLAGLVLESTIISCSKQEWINGWIIFLLEESDATNLDALNSKKGELVSEDLQGPALQSLSANGMDTDAELSGPSNSSETSHAAHKRTVSRAEYAMEEAMQEAKRLSELIAAEEARKERELGNQATSNATVNGVDGSASLTSGLVNVDVKKTQKLGPENGVENSRPPGNVTGPSSGFTDFDQILSTGNPSSLSDGPEPRSRPIPPLTLHDATVSIFDDSHPGEKATLRSKPNTEYLLQIEPASSQHPGWMIARRYVEFENLHEILRRISVVSGVPQFAKKHGVLPTWKNQTKASMRKDLEIYLRDALSFSRLAESEGMKRFLEKDQGLNRGSPNKQKTGFGFPRPTAFENMGKGMLDVLASAPKGAAGGSKAILGGVTGVFGGVGSMGQKKQPQTPTSKASPHGRHDSSAGEPVSGRDSQDSLQNSSSARTLISPSRSSLSLLSSGGESEVTSNSAESYKASSHERLSSIEKVDVADSVTHAVNELHLPPPPSEIPDDYKISQESCRTFDSLDVNNTAPFTGSTTPTSHPSPTRKSTSSLTPGDSVPMTSKQPKRDKPLPMTENETQVAVELFFAVINELYTLSSAWNIRRTLLNAAKGFLLRPGNPNLEAIRLLLQETLIDANTSDAGIAAHLMKLRENTLPTVEELQQWPKAPTLEEKEKMRVKARRLLVEKGMPLALTSVMGVAASGEALGRMFDCLQVEEVARGLMFSLILQALRAVTQ